MITETKEKLICEKDGGRLERKEEGLVDTQQLQHAKTVFVRELGFK